MHMIFFSVPFERQGEGIHVLREKEAHLKIIKNLDFDKMWRLRLKKDPVIYSDFTLQFDEDGPLGSLLHPLLINQLISYLYEYILM